MMNIVEEIAEFTMKTQATIQQLIKERDDFKYTADAQEREIRDLSRRITEGKAENQRLLEQLQAVRKTDDMKENQ